ncbi:MAG TPA: hypothetical protein VMM27_06410 [Casimicrobiaceae bacterium]|nr:hypothetical protein [Casimicrobiaceae bacterium]
MNPVKAFIVASLCAGSLFAASCFAVDRPYTMGSVWTVTLVRVKYGMDTQYLTDLAGAFKRSLDEARKQDLILSYKVLDGPSSNRDDWNLMILVEQKNWSLFDTPPEKFDAIADKMVGPEKQQMEMLVKRSDMREVVGTKNLQEILFK